MPRHEEAGSASARSGSVAQARTLRVNHEWPYMAGTTCLVVLLIWQPFQPSTLAVVFPQQQLQSTGHAAQRSLQEIDSSCYQVHTEAIVNNDCGEACALDKATSAAPGGMFEFSHSILTCRSSHSNVVGQGDTDKPENRMIEVSRSNHSF